MALRIFAQQARIFIVFHVVGGGRTVYQQDVAAVGKVENTFDVVGMQLTNFVHHTMHFEIAKLPRCFFFEHVDKHNVDHRLHQNIRTIRTYIGNLLHPTRIVVVLHHTELQVERIGHDKVLPRRFVFQKFTKCIQVFHGMQIDVRTQILRKQIHRTHIERILIIKLLHLQQQQHQFVITLQGTQFDATNHSGKVPFDEVFIDVFDGLVYQALAPGQFTCLFGDTAQDVHIPLADAVLIFGNLVVVDKLAEVGWKIHSYLPPSVHFKVIP